MKRVPLLMMKTRGLIAPLVQQGKKAATPTKRNGARSTGTYRIYKVLNP